MDVEASPLGKNFVGSDSRKRLTAIVDAVQEVKRMKVYQAVTTVVWTTINPINGKFVTVEDLTRYSVQAEEVSSIAIVVIEACLKIKRDKQSGHQSLPVRE